MSRSTDIIFLLGAGASVEAGIPTSADMIGKLEAKLSSNDDWKKYLDLYRHVKSAILFKDGIRGNFDNGSYNIESLVNTLFELERNEEHPLYPFIASWNARFASLAGERFGRVGELRRKILELLKDWVCPDDPTTSSYYQGLKGAQAYLNYPLKVFSLNYDLCVENLNETDFRVETGFENHGPRYPWTFERFIETELGENPMPSLFLYKLHGSIDWKRDPITKMLSRVPQISGIGPDEMEIIFGREAKLEAGDPYLFYAYEFRKACLDAKVVVALGYSFSDTHINKIIGQALNGGNYRRLLDVSNCTEADSEKRKNMLSETLGVGADKVSIETLGAKAFLGAIDLGERLQAYVPAEDVPF